MLELGTSAPEFSLVDTDGNRVRLSDFTGAKALLVMFICNHCPFVVHVADQLAKLGREYQAKGAAIVGLCSNDVETHPDDSPAKMKEEKASRGYTFPYLHDADQSVAKAYKAACTPDFFLFDADRKLVYRGQLDDSRPGNDAAIDGKDLRAALDKALAGDPIESEQKPSIGCNIKWKGGNAPTYA